MSAKAPGKHRNVPPKNASAAASGLDFGDVNLAHFHHRSEDAFGFSAAGG